MLFLYLYNVLISTSFLNIVIQEWKKNINLFRFDFRAHASERAAEADGRGRHRWGGQGQPQLGGIVNIHMRLIQKYIARGANIINSSQWMNRDFLYGDPPTI